MSVEKNKEEYQELLESTQDDHEEYVATEEEVKSLTNIPIQETEFITNEGENAPIIFDEVELIEAPTAETKNEELELDFQEARKNIYNGIQVAQDSLSKLAQIAERARHPRAYEVVALLAKTVVDSSKTLIDMHEKQKSITEDSGEGAKVVNNNMFVGSTEELDELIKKLKK